MCAITSSRTGTWGVDLPFTPYHFGVNGSVGLLLRRWVDVPICVLANVAIDVEVLWIGFFIGNYPYHRWAHSLLGGIVVGAVWGLGCYYVPFVKRIFGWGMRLFGLEYRPGAVKAVLSGILGALLHVIVDAFDHFDLNFWRPWGRWPSRWIYGRIDPNSIKELCLAFWAAAILIYLFIIARKIVQSKKQRIKNAG